MVNFFLPDFNQGMRQNDARIRSSRLENRKLFNAMIDDAAAEGRELNSADLVAFRQELIGGDPLMGAYLPHGEVMERLKTRQNERAMNVRLSEQVGRIKQSDELVNVGLSAVRPDMTPEEYQEEIFRKFTNPEDAQAVLSVSMPHFETRRREVLHADIQNAMSMVDWSNVRDTGDAERYMPPGTPKHVVAAVRAREKDTVENRHRDGIAHAEGQFALYVQQNAPLWVTLDDSSQQATLLSMADNFLRANGIHSPGQASRLMASAQPIINSMKASDTFTREQTLYQNLVKDETIQSLGSAREDAIMGLIQSEAASLRLDVSTLDPTRVAQAMERVKALKQAQYASTYSSSMSNIYQQASADVSATIENNTEALPGNISAATDNETLIAASRFLAEQYYLDSAQLRQAIGIITSDPDQFAGMNSTQVADAIAQTLGLVSVANLPAIVNQRVATVSTAMAANGHLGPKPESDPIDYVRTEVIPSLATEITAMVQMVSTSFESDAGILRNNQIHQLDLAERQTREWIQSYENTAWRNGSDIQGALYLLAEAFNDARTRISAAQPKPAPLPLTPGQPTPMRPPSSPVQAPTGAQDASPPPLPSGGPLSQNMRQNTKTGQMEELIMGQWVPVRTSSAPPMPSILMQKNQ